MLPRFLAAALFIAATPATAQAPAIPDALRPWTEWVMRGQETRACPFRQDDEGQRRCLFPGTLTLDVDASGGSFSLAAQAYAKMAAILPGDAERWPQEVTAGGKPALVQTQNGLPVVALAPGAHVVTGKFLWSRLPEAIHVPRDTGLVELTIAGKRVPFPAVDGEGRIFLAGETKSDADAQTDSLALEVFRHVQDDIPLQLTTRIELKIAGRNREIVLGPIHGAEFTPVRLDADLPTALQPDGRLKIQARPGSYAITLVARHAGPVESLKRPEVPEPWTDEEIWVFAAASALRLVTPSGAASIDPQQSSLPTDWKRLPAFLMAKDAILELTTRKRGDPDPAPDQLGLTRDVWLDFDGGGYTFRDRIKGKVSRSWRLSVAKPAELGRAAIQGRDQLLTKLASDGGDATGLEVRLGNLALEADLRVDGRTSELPATAWRADFQSVAASLHLPPGYRLLAAFGVDQTSGTWLKRWDLLNIFIVLLVSLALGKLLGWRTATLALVTLILVIPEANAPRYLWLAFVPALALKRYLPAGKLRTATVGVHATIGVLLALVIFAFAVEQIREAMFPSLEYPWRKLEAPVAEGAMPTGALDDEMPVALEAPMEQNAEEAESGAPSEPAAPPAGGPSLGLSPNSDAPSSFGSGGGGFSKKGSKPEQQRMLNRQFAYVDPNATVQTGPGLPAWSWNRFQLAWNGPVRQDQTFRLVVLPPWANKVFAFLRVGLSFLLLILVLGVDPRQFGKWAGRLGTAAVALALLAFGTASGTRPALAQTTPVAFPPDSLLNELRDRLIQRPDCMPQCATLARLSIEASGDSVTMLIEAHMATGAAIPLPGNTAYWLPASVQVDGQAAKEMRREDDGSLWLALTAGVHRVELKGALPERETVEIPLPLRPRHVSFKGNGWRADGVHEDGAADATLMLIREREKTATGAKAPAKDAGLPPFLRVERQLTLGLDWSVTTTVHRLGGDGAALMRIPLLSTERVTTPGVRVEGGAVLVNLGPRENSFTWTGALDISEKVALKAPDTLAWTEWWKVDLAPTWHLETKGIPVIHRVDAQGELLPEWRPWPGETVELAISRPEALVGRSLTMDRAYLDVKPGLRSSEVTLSVSLRSSRGGEHKIALPADVELQTVVINGTTQPIRLEAGAVTLPLLPGAQSARISWRDVNGMRPLYRTTALDLGLPGVNATVRVEVPAERWLLFLGGQGSGPAVLFWSQLLVIALAAFALGKIPLTPIRSWQWFLLGVGLTQSSLEGAGVVIGLFLALGLRRAHAQRVTNPGLYNVIQLALIAWTLAAVGVVFASLQQGFFGRPDMQIAGNASNGHELLWFQDRTAGPLPSAWIVSVPLLVYQLAMLAWALWFAFAAVRWSRWVADCATAGGFWRKYPPRAPTKIVFPNAPGGAASPAAGTEPSLSAKDPLSSSPTDHKPSP